MKKQLLTAGILAILLLSLTGCGAGKKGISKEEYNEIELGDTLMHVSSIVGGNGEKIEESKTGYITTYVYRYDGERKGYAIITYEADTSDLIAKDWRPLVVSKKQVDLK